MTANGGQRSGGSQADVVDIVEEALVKFAAHHPEVRKAEIPAPLKWAGGIGAAVMTAMMVSFFVWLTSAVNGMQVTVARIDERQTNQITAYDVIERRLNDLESYHKQGRGL